MNKGGVLVTQNGVPIFQPRELISSIAKFRRLFADGTCYIAAVPTYVGGHMAMGWATDDTQTAPSLGQNAGRALSQGRRLFRPDIGRRRSMPPRSHCRASLLTWWQKQDRGDKL